MPLTFRIDPEANRVLVQVEGVFTLEEIVDLISEVVESPDVRPGFDILSDHTRVERPITPNQAHGMVAHLRALSRHFEKTRWAVVTRNPASYGMLRMIAVLAEQVPIRVEIFETVSDAEAWLRRDRGEGRKGA